MSIFLLLLGVYAVVGVLFGVWFAARGAGVIDAAAGAAPLRVRLAFVPGAAALWPLLVAKLIRRKGAR